MAEPKNIRIQLAFATRQRQQEISVEVPGGLTLQQAVALLASEIAGLLNGDQGEATGVWGKIRPPHYVLREGDRIEIYRPLKADPKQARRARVGQKYKSG